MSSPIDLTRLPVPDLIEVIDYEATLASRRSAILAAMPPEQRDEVSAALTLESEPLNKLLQENVLRDIVLQHRINTAGRAVLLAFARGADQDHVGANFNTRRLTVTPADPQANPPVSEVKEDDEVFQLRIQEAFDGLSVAGPSAAYEFFARSAHGQVRDARCISPAPCEVVVAVVSTEGDGRADEALLDVVRAALNGEETRPLGDLVTVQSAEILHYEIEAVLFVSAGPESALIRDAAMHSTQAEVRPKRPLGRSVYLSRLDAALHVEGVLHVVIQAPASNMLLSKLQAAYCRDIKLTLQVIDV